MTECLKIKSIPSQCSSVGGILVGESHLENQPRQRDYIAHAHDLLLSISMREDPRYCTLLRTVLVTKIGCFQ